MNVEVLLSAMNQKDYSILDKMNIQTKAVVINQSEKNEFETFNYHGHRIKFLSFNERGVGLSRNNALMRATSDICLMADEDMVYVDGYEDIVLNAFEKRPQADIILFNVPVHHQNGQTVTKVKRDGRIRFYNALKYGTVNIAFRKESIFKKNIFFSLLFGGGARYGSGEDVLFIAESLKKGLKIYSCQDVIANITEQGSTWFEGYNENYFFNKGALFQALGGKPFSLLLIIQFLVRKRELFTGSLETKTVFKKMLDGRRDFLKR